MKLPPNVPCACHSAVKYKRCCRPFHRGVEIERPEDLVRARYAAFAYGLVAFVIETTDPSGPSVEPDPGNWERSILDFAGRTDFVGLEIQAATQSEDEGEVTFRATLRQGGKDVSFTEASRFVRDGGRWLYHSGVVS